MLHTVYFGCIESCDGTEWSANGSIHFTNQPDADAWIASNSDWIFKPCVTVHDVDVVITDNQYTLMTDVPCSFIEHTPSGWKSMDESIAYFLTDDDIDPAGHLSVFDVD